MKIAQHLNFSATPFSIALSVIVVLATGLLGYYAWRRSGYAKSIGMIELMRLAIVDPETGLPVVPERRIHADLVAYGGTLAMIAEARGETQKVRISAHLAEVIRQELTMADGYPGVRLGMVQVLSLQ